MWHTSLLIIQQTTTILRVLENLIETNFVNTITFLMLNEEGMSTEIERLR
jgi:hypothetical protein